MKRKVFFGVLAAVAASCEAVAVGGVPVGGIAQVAIVDRNSGIELVPHYYRGEYWVAGTPGATYGIVIRNRLGERLLAVTSVDGINVISGATAAWNQTGYVFDPNQGYEITGWRKSDSEVAAFTFTASPNSYAERTGRPANVGVIGVALFREQQPQAAYAEGTPVPAPAPVPSPTSAAESAGASASASAAAPAPSGGIAARAAPSPPSTSTQPLPRSYAPSVQANAPKLGTGHGERQFSYVNHTDFMRMQPEPNEVIRIRYDSFDNLVAMGIIEQPRPAAPTANPFPGSPAQRYVPDPPG